jgi:ABC-2 type transport system ATP-binding protein
MSQDVVITHGKIQRGSSDVVNAGEIRAPVGSIVGLIGLNGAGKTSLMLAISGVLAGDPQVQISGVASPSIGYLPQESLLPSWLTPTEIIRLYGMDPQHFAVELSDFQIDSLYGKKSGQLSTGQRQLLGALITIHPGFPLTLLDEPFAGLDMLRRRQLIDLLRRRSHGAERLTTIISSQIPEELEEICDWFVVLREGTYVFQGARNDLLGLSPSGDGRSTLREFEERVLQLMLMGPASTG